MTLVSVYAPVWNGMAVLAALITPLRMGLKSTIEVMKADWRTPLPRTSRKTAAEVRLSQSLCQYGTAWQYIATLIALIVWA